MSAFDVNATDRRQSSVVDAVSLPDERVLDVVDLVATDRLNVTGERRLATRVERHQPELCYVSRHASASFNRCDTICRNLTRYSTQAGLRLHGKGSLKAEPNTIYLLWPG